MFNVVELQFGWSASRINPASLSSFSLSTNQRFLAFVNEATRFPLSSLIINLQPDFRVFPSVNSISNNVVMATESEIPISVWFARVSVITLNVSDSVLLYTSPDIKLSAKLIESAIVSLNSEKVVLLSVTSWLSSRYKM